MPGRQSHGRSLMAAPKAKQQKRSKARSHKAALNAFGIAEEQYPTKITKTPRARDLDIEIERKHSREEDDDEGEDEDEEEGPSRKKVKRPARTAEEEGDYGSDSEGNEWRLGGLREDDEDSEIESDDAFGDSDNERFEEYSFRGSKSKPNAQDDDDESDDSNDDEGETLGAEAIDLATALDQFEDESEDEPEGSDGSDEASDDDEDDDEDDEDSEDDDEDDEDDSDDEPQSGKLEALEGIISQYGGVVDDSDKPAAKQKISMGDLGLSGLDDPFMKKSVKLMNKESKEKRPGASKKLDIPLSRREQGRIDRAAAYETTNKTLDRWTDTVKHNRRAEHLVFPLPENSASAGLDRTEIQPLSTTNPSNDLESAIMSIMEQSGLSMDKPKKEKKVEYDSEGNELTQKEILNRKRMQRELNSREAKRAKRIKKIKSKAYHRVHRRAEERDNAATREAMEEAGEIDSEQEREEHDRRRALERVGQRHKDSKWAKLGNKAKRAVWDDEYRAGLTEMARKDEELRRRKEGRASRADDDDSDATSSSGSDSDDDETLRRQLNELEQDDDEPQSKLMSMKFMQKAEASRKQANDQLIKDIRRELDGEEAISDDEETGEVGRRQYGVAQGKAKPVALDTSSRASKRDTTAPVAAKNYNNGHDNDDDDEDVEIKTSATTSNGLEDATTGAWSRGQPRRKNKTTRSGAVDFDDNILLEDAPVAAAPKTKTTSSTVATKSATQDDSDDSADEADRHLPMAIRDQQLVARAFAGDDVVAEFEAEKDDMIKDQDDKIIDDTLPGWGSWVGEGVSGREKKRHQGRFLTKVEGIKKNDRKDAKLAKVIINEKRIKKNDKFLASALPHMYESKDQYERSLRLPVGPEWMTKETFQGNTKPRVLIKQGIIAPMSKPSK